MKTATTVHPFDAQYEGREGQAGYQWLFDFPNGYSASVVRGPYTYGGPEGLWELAVMVDGHLTYDTPITSDVIGHLTEAEVSDLLGRIRDLPKVGA